MDNIALQVYTVRTLAQDDFPGTLRQAADIGYRAVELAGLYDLSTAEARRLLDDLDMRAVSTHLSADVMQSNPQQALTDALELGCSRAALSWVGEEWRGSEEQAHRLADLLNRWGETSRDAGLPLGYHNHDFEFADLGGTTMYEILTAETDPDLVFLELDVYWSAYAGLDPAQLLRQHVGRVPLLHMKDMADDEKRSFAPVGTGTLQWSSILSAARDAGVEWYIVEQDTSRDPLEDIRTSLANLRGLLQQ